MTYPPAPCILLVDDEPALQMTLGLLMESAGYQVLVASNGVEALEILESRAPDLIVTDFMMPRMDGLVLLARIRERGELLGVPVLLTSAIEITVPDLPGAAITFLHKPVSWQKMKTTIEQLLHRPSED